MHAPVEEPTESTASELAALYALGALDDEGEASFEGLLLSGHRAASAALDEADAVVALLPFAVEPQSPSPQLRSRLFAAINQSEPVPTRSKPLPEVAREPLTVRAADHVWSDYQGRPGVQIQRLYVDETNREMLCLIRSEGGVRHVPHRHTAAEEIFMIEGHLKIDGIVYGPGDFVRSQQDSIHGPSEALDTCMFLLRTSLDNQLLIGKEWSELRIEN
ncbi:MAG: cupin domain-containing protein [Blastocatellia bacterium]|nr:cupin domain-containing protein [Blastocatellia bacterium]